MSQKGHKNAKHFMPFEKKKFQLNRKINFVSHLYLGSFQPDGAILEIFVSLDTGQYSSFLNNAKENKGASLMS